MDAARLRDIAQEELRDSGQAVRQLQGRLLAGRGAPSDPPRSPRALYLDLEGAAGSIVFVWDGASWTAFA